MDKQKMLLSQDVGHFSLVRAMHLADLITLMNGTPRPSVSPTIYPVIGRKMASRRNRD